MAQTKKHKEAFFLPYARHSLTTGDRAAVMAVLATSADQRLTQGLLTQGTRVTDFENSVRDYTGARYAVACANGTAALHAALVAVGVGGSLDTKDGATSEVVDGVIDGVITQAISFCATANVVRHCGAMPIFADIDGDSIGLCPRSTREALVWARKCRGGCGGGRGGAGGGGGGDAEKLRVKTLLPVHMGGVAHASAELRALGNEFDCKVVEDAAHGLGGYYANGRAIGCGDYADITIFSCHPIKPITSAEGGIAVTNDEILAKRMRHFCNHGIERDRASFQTSIRDRNLSMEGYGHYEMQSLGLNYRLSELHAALGASQMRRLASMRSRRREVALHYDHLLASGLLSDIVEPLQTRARECSAHHLYLVAIDYSKLSIGRGQLMRELKELGIGTQVHYIPIYRHPYYRMQEVNSSTHRCPVVLGQTERYAERTLSLPLFSDMRREDAERVVDGLMETVAKVRLG